MLERYSDPLDSTGSEAVWSPFAIPDSHDGTDLVGIKYGSRATEMPVRISKHTSAPATRQTRGISPLVRPTNTRLSSKVVRITGR